MARRGELGLSREEGSGRGTSTPQLFQGHNIPLQDGCKQKTVVEGRRKGKYKDSSEKAS